MRICIVAHFAYGALAGGGAGHVGGVERQTTMLARWLAQRGHQVSLVTWDEGQGDDKVIDGVRVIPMCRQSDGLPGLRFFVPRWTSLLRAVKKADAELYYFNAAEAATGQLAVWCRRNGRKFIYSVANDLECLASIPRIKAPQARLFYRRGIRYSSVVISQSAKQQRLLLENFNRESIPLPMPCPGPDESVAVNTAGRARKRVLWAARLEQVKRLDILLDVAQRNPDLQFDVAAPINADNQYQREMLARAKSLPNVTMHGRVERERMPEMYRQADVLCCTSDYEGFPNTFLEAWSWGVPVVSTVDPDDIIARCKLGAPATQQTVTEALRSVLSDAATYEQMAQNARRYYLANHQVEGVMLRFEEVFLNTIGGRAARGARA